MNELARWDPFKAATGTPDLSRWDPFQDSVFDLMPAFFAPAVRRAPVAGPRMDVAENDGAYHLAVELPGLPKDAIQVSVCKNTVTVSAEAPEQKDGEASWLLRERSNGKFSRTIGLPDDVDDSGSEAKYLDGVLYLTLPKTSASRTKRIDIR